MNPDTEYMVHMTGDTVELVVERTVDEAGRTFSADAMDELARLMIAWVVTRVARRWDDYGEPPQRVSVIVSVDLDERPVVDTDPL